MLARESVLAVTEPRDEDREEEGEGLVQTLETTDRSIRGRCFYECETKDEVVKLLTEAFPNRTHVIETERYFAKGLENFAPTVNEETGMPTVQNLSEVQRKCGVRGRDELHERDQ